MKVLDLFAGSRSIGMVADELGFKCFSVDIIDFENIDLVKDIEFLEITDFPFIPDIGWASPLCTSYSIAAVSHHRKGVVPVSELARKSDRVIQKTIKLFKEIEKVNPDFKWYLENPVGMLRKMPFMKEFDRATVYYCRYGDIRMKPTDIWTNNLRTMYNPDGWQPRKKCWNGNKKCHHEQAPRGSRTGTQGLKNDYERSKIPYELCKEILLSVVHAYQV